MSTQSDVIFNRLVISASEQKASDLFLFPGQIPSIKVDGKVRPLTGEPVIAGSFIEEILTSLLSPSQQEEYKKQWQLIFSKEVSKGQRAKINVFKQKDLSAISLELVPNKFFRLESSKLPKVIADLASLDRGLIVLSGPKDSGKTSLMASMIDYINRNFSKYIATIERPIEYFFIGDKSLVEQREIGRDVSDFKEGLASIKNRDIDVLVISDIENPAMLFELLEIAQKGVLVFVIMDIDSAFNVVRQFIEFFDKDKQTLIQLLLGENLGGIICTRLVPRMGGGRILALEVLNGSPAAKIAIKEGKFHQIHNLLQITEKELSISLDRFLAGLVQAGEITVEEALKHCLDENNLQALVRR